MAQDLADLGQSRTGAQHLGRRGVAEAMGVHLRQAGPGARRAHDRGHAAGAQPSMRCPHPGEHVGAFAVGTAPTQPADKRVADVDGHGKPLLASALAADDDLPMAPLDVGQLQCRHLPGPQPEADQQGQHREVPPAERAAPVTARQQAGDLRAAERRGQTRQAPSRHPRHRRLELALGVALHEQEAQQ